MYVIPNTHTHIHVRTLAGSEGINTYAVHPGNAVSTGLARHWWGYRLLYTLARPFTKTLVSAGEGKGVAEEGKRGRVYGCVGREGREERGERMGREREEKEGEGKEEGCMGRKGRGKEREVIFMLKRKG